MLPKPAFTMKDADKLLFCFRVAPAAVRSARSKQKEGKMRHLIKFALLAGAALAVSGCNRGAPAASNAAGEVVDNGALEMPGNDASAIESVTNTPLPPPADTNATNSATPDTAPPPPSTPNVESNVAGM
jgi:hypothetical protein